MTSKLVTAKLGTSVKVALELMEEHHFRHLPVVDTDGKVVGIMSDRDFLSVADFETMKVDKVMTTIVHSVPESAPIKQSVQTMIDKKISCLMVHDSKNKPCGIVTTDDIMREYVKSQS